MGIFRKHDEVYLSLKEVVGSGTLRKVFPSDFIYGTPLAGRIGVMIDDVFNDGAELPFLLEVLLS